MREENHYIAQALSIIFSIGVFMIVSIFISRNYSPAIDVNQIKEMFAPGWCRSNISPESAERAIYLIWMIIFPIFLYFSHILFYKLLRGYSNSKKLNTVHILLSYFIVFSLYFLFYIDFNVSPSNYNDPLNFLRHNYFYNYPIKSFLGFSLVLLLLMFDKKNKRINKTLLYIVYSLSIILIISLSLTTIFDVYNPWTGNQHFGAVFYPMVQVYLGKALLVDFQNQYGLYPHFLEPLFKVIGLSVFKFTVVMAVIMSISFLLIFKFLKDIIRSKIIFFCGFFTVIFYNYIAFEIFTGGSVYFHLYPIRFYTFPAVMIYLAWKYFNNNNKNLYYLSFVLYPLAILWNRDTGIIGYLSWLLVLSYQELLQSNFKIAIRKIILHIMIGISALITIFIFYWLYIYLRYDNWPIFNLLYEYQKQYLLYGFGNLPMRLLYPWNLIILIYITGLSYSVRSLVSRRDTPRTKMVLWLSLFGVGIFTYYQGRTADNALFNVCYPAFLLLTIFVDDLFFSIKDNMRSYRKVLLGAKILLFISLMYVLSSSVFSVIFNYRFIYDSIKDKFYVSITSKKVPTSTIKNAEFIKGHVTKCEEVLIISYDSHICHLLSETTCSVKIPYIIELHQMKDYEKLKDFLINGDGRNKKVFLDIGNINDLDWPEIFEILTKNYRIIDKTMDGRTIFFLR